MPHNLDSITWTDKNAYKNDPTKKASIETQVDNYAPKVKDAKQAAIRCVHVSLMAHDVEHTVLLVTRGTAHTGGTNPKEKEHVTVNFEKADGTHITTKHVYT